ncbi:unnamed protein product [Cyprideis torosa]|uniref:Uncharacterized protein n=1 Tax=Cyprideis torosa TaxID=163714 RepID=A0A7R8W099_9CRUS|nr:unnamed protein product [Cyprideis torosa]CAG0879535.1 unnamed protein product [Cyprideis torosa]
MGGQPQFDSFGGGGVVGKHSLGGAPGGSGPNSVIGNGGPHSMGYSPHFYKRHQPFPDSSGAMSPGSTGGRSDPARTPMAWQHRDFNYQQHGQVDRYNLGATVDRMSSSSTAISAATGHYAQFHDRNPGFSQTPSRHRNGTSSSSRSYEQYGGDTRARQHTGYPSMESHSTKKHGRRQNGFSARGSSTSTAGSSHARSRSRDRSQGHHYPPPHQRHPTATPPTETTETTASDAGSDESERTLMAHNASVAVDAKKILAL